MPKEEFRKERLIYSATQGIFTRSGDGGRHILRETLLEDGSVILPTKQGQELVEAIKAIFDRARINAINVNILTEEGFYIKATDNIAITPPIRRLLEGIHQRHDRDGTAPLRLDCINAHKTPQKEVVKRLEKQEEWNIQEAFKDAKENSWKGEDGMVAEVMDVLKKILPEEILVRSNKLRIENSVKLGFETFNENESGYNGAAPEVAAADLVVAEVNRIFAGVAQRQGRTGDGRSR